MISTLRLPSIRRRMSSVMGGRRCRATNAWNARAFPICRSITGDGVRRTLALAREIVPLEVREVPSGTPALDWTVPPEWNVRAAWIAGPDGRRVVTAGIDREVRLWDEGKGWKSNWSHATPERVFSLAIDARDRFVLAGLSNGAIDLVPLPPVAGPG